MKHLLSLIIVVCTFISLQAQFEKTPIAIEAFAETSGMMEETYLLQMQEMVVSAFVNTKRFEVVEGIDDATGYAMTGNVIAYTVKENYNEDGTTTYEAEIKLTLKVKDLETGQITATETISSKTAKKYANNALKLVDKAGLNADITDKASQVGGFVTAETEEEALAESLKGLNKAIDKFIVKNFPFKALVADITTTRGAEAVSILILTGPDSGLKKGDKLTVVEVTKMEVGGKSYTRRKEIGEVRLDKFEGDFSECVVRKGGRDIQTKFEKGAKLVCMTDSGK